MAIVLPTKKQQVLDYNPRLLVIYSKPKMGKSTFCAALDDNLIIDLDKGGYRALEAMVVPASSYTELREIAISLYAKKKELGKVPFRFITLDNSTHLEEYCLYYALLLYRQTQQGKEFGNYTDKDGRNYTDKDGKTVFNTKADVRQLPRGGGYLYVREAVKRAIEMFMPYCETLILIGHVKDSLINKDGKEMSEMSLDLSGRLSDIICGDADAVGFMRREGNQSIISFKTSGDLNKGARPKHLREKEFVVIEELENGELKVNTKEIFI